MMYWLEIQNTKVYQMNLFKPLGTFVIRICKNFRLSVLINGFFPTVRLINVKEKRQENHFLSFFSLVFFAGYFVFKSSLSTTSPPE